MCQCVMLHGGRLYTAHVMSAVDFSHLRRGSRVLVFNAHLFSMSQVLVLPSSFLLTSSAAYLFFFVCDQTDCWIFFVILANFRSYIRLFWVARRLSV